MRKKILIKSYVNLNLGDDLFVKMLCNRYPQHQFYLIGTRSATKYLKEIPNLTIIFYPFYVDGFLYRIKSQLRLLHHMELYISSKVDGVVYIGGSIFMEPEKNYQIETNRFAQLIKKNDNFYVIGSNFGPYKSKGYYNDYYNNFKKVKDVCFRDEYSYGLFNDLITTRLAPDVVFSLDHSSVPIKEDNDYIIISVIDLISRQNLKSNANAYEKSIVEMCTQIIKRGKKVILISFCKEEGDEDAIERISKLIDSDWVSSYYYEGNIDEALSLLKSSSGVIATRFHSLVLAWVFEKPVFPFIYSKKTLNLLEDNSFEGYSLSIKDIHNLDFDRAISELFSNQTISTDHLIRESKNQFMQLDKYLS